jgi:hypothetical protein
VRKAPGGRRGKGRGREGRGTRGWKLPEQKAPTMSVSRGLPFPDRMIVRLTAEANATVTDIDTYQDLVVSGNSAFDPFAALGSAQPMFYDTLAALYDRYRVLGSQVRCNAQITSGATQCPMAGIVGPADQSTGLPDYAAHSSLPYVRRNMTTALGTQKWLVSRRLSSAKIQGLSSVEYSDNESALISANPADGWYWHIAYLSNQSTSTLAANVTIIWTADVEFYDRQAQGLSLFTCMQRNAELRKEYLALKEKTPNRDGRIAKKKPLDDLKEYVEACGEWSQVLKMEAMRVQPLPWSGNSPAGLGLELKTPPNTPAQRGSKK